MLYQLSRYSLSLSLILLLYFNYDEISICKELRFLLYLFHIDRNSTFRIEKIKCLVFFKKNWKKNLFSFFAGTVAIAKLIKKGMKNFTFIVSVLLLFPPGISRPIIMHWDWQ